MILRTMLAGGCALACLSTISPTYAASYRVDDDAFGTLRLQGGLGVLRGEAGEYVYKAHGSRLSKLNWRIPETPIAKLGVSWDITRQMTFDVRGWTTLSSNKAQVDDYDWMQDDDRWTDWSTHPDTTLRYAKELELGFSTWLLVTSNWRLGLALGYQSSRFAWSSHGGQYRYDSGQRVGGFSPDTHLIDYQQRYDVPWVGVAGQIRTGRFELNALAKFSNAARGVAEDSHSLRNLHFRDEVERARYYGVTLDAGYYMTSQFKLYTEATWNCFEESKGRSMATNTATGQRVETRDGSVGMQHQDYSVSLGMQLSF